MGYMPKKKQSFRLTQVYSKEEIAKLDKTCAKLNLNRTAVIKLALAKLQDAEKIT
jgi:hypothetical protein